MTTTLRALCDLISDQVSPRSNSDSLYIGLEHVQSTRFHRIGGGRESQVESGKFAFRKGDVLYGKLRPYLDKAIVADADGICTTELLVLRPKKGISAEFLVGVLHSPSFIEHAMSGVTGVQHPRTSWQRIAEFELPNLGGAERDQIASLLWLAHDAITLNESVEAELAALKRAAMRELFTRGLRGEAQKETEIGPIPESWEAIPLERLGRIGNGSTPKRTVPEYWSNAHNPWLTSAKVYDREITRADQFVSDVALAECHLPRVKPGAVLIAITGQGKTLGHCAVLSIEASVSQHVAYIQVDPAIADSGFVRGFLETQYEYLRQIASGGGSTKGALTCAFLRSFHMPLPPVPEQREIVAILDAVDRKISLHKEKRAVLEALFKSLLHKLMTGEVRVADLNLDALGRAAEAA